MSHTPGPWESVFKGGIGYYSIETRHSSRTVVSHVRQRDAYLIAAAPELLNALELWAEYHDLTGYLKVNGRCPKWMDKDFFKRAEATMAALKKARGKL